MNIAGSKMVMVNIKWQIMAMVMVMVMVMAMAMDSRRSVIALVPRSLAGE